MGKNILKARFGAGLVYMLDLLMSVTLLQCLCVSPRTEICETGTCCAASTSDRLPLASCALIVMQEAYSLLKGGVFCNLE